MKNKISAKFLLPLVLAIWGLIGWKFYAAMNGNEKPPAMHKEPNAVSRKTEIISDSVQLIANYRDPFLGQQNEPRIVKPKTFSSTTSKPVKTEIPKPVFVDLKINYYGLVKRNGDSKAVGFLSINGNSHFVQSGQIIDELKILHLWKDSVELLKGKEKLVVRK